MTVFGNRFTGKGLWPFGIGFRFGRRRKKDFNMSILFANRLTKVQHANIIIKTIRDVQGKEDKETMV
ncbi:MAG: hypothetical protein C4522_11585 [Desulfobacteraceae bacterium]|nr:MAG: hypothetical protein C4522_11585 [Desulfobacteraceae bacterium]